MGLGKGSKFYKIELEHAQEDGEGWDTTTT